MARYKMTPLTQQLEDKKKEQSKLDNWAGRYTEEYNFTNDELKEINQYLDYGEEYLEDLNLHSPNTICCALDEKLDIVKAEIAILEQAITEMQKQRQEFLDVLQGMQKLDIYYDKQMAVKTLILAERYITGDIPFPKQQLNQPKTEDELPVTICPLKREQKQ